MTLEPDVNAEFYNRDSDAYALDAETLITPDPRIDTKSVQPGTKLRVELEKIPKLLAALSEDLM